MAVNSSLDLGERDELVRAQVNELLRGFRALGEGDFSFRAKAIEGSGAAVLADGFNKMAAELKDVIAMKKGKIDRLGGLGGELKTLDPQQMDLLARTSHELRTPITPLLIQLQLLQKGRFGDLTEKQAESIGMIERNIKRLNGLITDILNLSKLNAGEVKLFRKSTDLNALVSDVVNTFKPDASEKNIVLSLNADGELPQIQADPDRVTEVLVNLVNNAVKFAGRNGWVIVETKKQGETAVVCVKDSGIGIAREDFQKLFKPFSRGGAACKNGYSGTGLGLCISKNLVELHGGSIWAESEGEGKGSAFYISLPIKVMSKGRGEKADG